MSKTSSGDTHQPVSRLAAKLGHSAEVRSVSKQSDARARIYTTNNGIGIREINTIRSFGWEICKVSPRFNVVSVRRVGQ